MLEYFEIEIDSSLHDDVGATATHRFHQALLEELRRPKCPLYVRLGKTTIQAFLLDFRKFRNNHKCGNFSTETDRQQALSRLDFQSRWPELACALCDVVKAIKMEAARRSNGTTAWGHIRTFEFSQFLRRDWYRAALSGEVKDTEPTRKLAKIQDREQMLHSFVKRPMTSLRIIESHSRLTAELKETKAHCEAQVNKNSKLRLQIARLEAEDKLLTKRVAESTSYCLWSNLGLENNLRLDKRPWYTRNYQWLNDLSVTLGERMQMVQELVYNCKQRSESIIKAFREKFGLLMIKILNKNDERE